uniref:Putative misato shows similarity with tubulin/ftsz family of gtp n=1 Tax=Ixodes ricinus TaxID=34613 RepID=A0A0K8RIV7_IXORI
MDTITTAETTRLTSTDRVSSVTRTLPGRRASLTGCAGLRRTAIPCRPSAWFWMPTTASRDCRGASGAFGRRLPFQGYPVLAPVSAALPGTQGRSCSHGAGPQVLQRGHVLRQSVQARFRLLSSERLCGPLQGHRKDLPAPQAPGPRTVPDKCRAGVCPGQLLLVCT